MQCALPHPQAKYSRSQEAHPKDEDGQQEPVFCPSGKLMLLQKPWPPHDSLCAEPKHSQKYLTCPLELESIHEQRGWHLEKSKN